MASKDNKSLIIWHAIFALLAVGMGVAWYFTWNHTADLQQRLDASTKADAGAKSEIQNLQTEVTTLKELIGRTTGTTDEVVAATRDIITRNAGDGSASTLGLDEGLVKAALDRDANSSTSAERLIHLNTKIAELTKLIEAQTGAGKAVKATLDQKDQELRDKERVHGEQLAQRRMQFDEISTQLVDVQARFSNSRDVVEREKTALNDEIFNQQVSLKTLRKEKMLTEDLKFERPDGSLLFVDQNAQLCTIDLGVRDDLRIGTTFSVYAKNNSGVGRRQSDKDIKGKIEIVELLGAHLAKARIVDEKQSDPIASGDPIYSPLFWPGQSLQIAVVGMLEFDGNPGSDRVEFNQIVEMAGAEIVIQVDDQGKVQGKNGEELSRNDVPSKVTSATRFLIVGDLGSETTVDTAQKEIYNRIRALKVDMEDAANSNGVYVLPLDSFLEYIGYSSKRLVFTPTKPFPGVLTNGAKSPRVNGRIGSRESSASISGAFSARRQKPSVSMGHTTKLYSAPRQEE